MPYIVKTSLKKPNFPDICPYCNKRKADKLYNYTIWKSSIPYWVPNFYYKFELPTCNKCKKFLDRSKLYFWLLFVVPLLLYSIKTMIYPDKLVYFSLYIYLFCLLGLIVFGLYRIYVYRSLKVGDFNKKKKTVSYCTRLKDYSEEFAKLNNTVSQKKCCFIQVY